MHDGIDVTQVVPLSHVWPVVQQFVPQAVVPIAHDVLAAVHVATSGVVLNDGV